MNFFETIFLNLGFSWTAAKLIPYLLMALLGFILVYTFHRRIQHRVKKWISMTLLCLLPFGIYFAVYPIYQGDFVNVHFKPKQLDKFPSKLTLNIVVLPSCPYCHETIKLMNNLKESYPNLNIRYVVVAESKQTMHAFRSKLDPKIDVQLSNKPDNWIIMAQGGFPCIILSKNKNIIYAWESGYFGVRAIDDILNRLN
jgi:thiol-disulfide isomerase/thioredoxin